MLALFATLFLLPPTHELATPGPAKVPLPGTDFIHLRWKSLRDSGYWAPPTIKLPFAGTYWLSAGTKSVVRTYSAEQFNQRIAEEGLTVVGEYRKRYKRLSQPERVVTAEYAKTMITVGPPEPIQPIELNLPIEFVLRYPQLVQLNYRGRPIDGVQVNLNGKALGHTNGAGQLPLPSLNFPARLSATVARAYPDQDTASWEFFTATLTLPPLSQRQAAIDDRELPGNELGGRQKVNHRVGDLVAGAIAAGGRFVAQGDERRRIGFLKRNRTGGHAIYADLRRPGPRHRPRHVNHTRL